MIPGSGRSPGEGNGNPLQYSCLENPMDRGAWWATVYGVGKSCTRLSVSLSLTHTHTHTHTHARTHTHSCPIYPMFWLPLRSDRVVLSFQVERDLTPSDSHVSLPDCSGDLEGVFIKGHMDRARVDRGNSFTPRTDPGDLRPLEDVVACLHVGTVAECPCSCRGRQIKLDTD